MSRFSTGFVQNYLNNLDPATATSSGPTGPAGGDLIGNYPNPFLIATGVTPGTYGDTTNVAQVTVDTAGRITAISNVSIAQGSGGASGPAFGDLTGTYPGPFLIDTGVVPGIYGDATNVAQFQVDSNGRLLFAGDVPITFPPSAPTGPAGGDLTGTYPNPVLIASGVIAGTYGDATNVAQFTVDTKGRLTSAGTVAITTGSIVVMDNAAAGNKYPTAPQTEGIWYGNNAKANCLNPDSVNLGNFATAGANRGVSIGGYSLNSVLSNNNGVAIGFNAQATGASTVAIGNGAFATTTFGVAIGPSATAGQEGVAIGNGVNSGLYSVSIGRGLIVPNASTVCIGNTNTAASGVCIGVLCSNTAGGTQINIGQQNTCTSGNEGTTAIGYQCSTFGTNALCFGRGNGCSGVNFYGICMGNNSGSNGGTAIGSTVNADTGAIAIGATVNSTGAFGGGPIAPFTIGIGSGIQIPNAVTQTFCVGNGISNPGSSCAGFGDTLNFGGINNAICLGSSASVNSANYALSIGVNTSSVSAASLNLRLNNTDRQIEAFTKLYQTFATAAGDTILDYTGANSSKRTYFTGVTTQNVIVPVAVGGILGYEIKIVNNSTGAVSVWADAAKTSLITTLAGAVAGVSRGGWGFFTLIGTGANVAGNWSAELGTTMI